MDLQNKLVVFIVKFHNQVGRLQYVVFLSGDIQHTGTSTPEKMSTSTTKVSTSLTPIVESQFQCQFWSIPLRFRCDGITHCVPDGSDEHDCPEVPTIPSPTVLEVGP